MTDKEVKKKATTKKKSKKNENMKLWDKVCETDPAITKRVNTRGGFTSIDAQTQIKRATELWGAYGNKWGLRHLSYEMIYDNHKPIGLSLIATFYYPKPPKPKSTASTSSSQPYRSSRNGNNNEVQFPCASDIAYQPGNDCFKKLSTDVLTKALSRLGFNSDVFEGKFEDNKYVAEMKAKFKTAKLPDVKEFEPGAKAVELLNRIAVKYRELDPIYFQDHDIDMDKLKIAVFNKWGKYPSKDSAVTDVPKVIEAKDISVIKEIVKEKVVKES